MAHLPLPDGSCQSMSAAASGSESPGRSWSSHDGSSGVTQTDLAAGKGLVHIAVPSPIGAR